MNQNDMIQSAASSTTAATPAVPSAIGVDELRLLLSLSDSQGKIRGKRVVAEVLPAQYFAAGHLPGAVHLPLDGFEARAQELFPDRGATVVVYCASLTCANSDIAARKLVSMGYRRVRVFSGGKAAWREAGLPLET